jgi:hypothetical protein
VTKYLVAVSALLRRLLLASLDNPCFAHPAAHCATGTVS